MFIKSKKRSIIPIFDPIFIEKKIEVNVQIDDSIYDDCSGNKWWKLKYNILQAKQNNFNKILTFGGAYSNHIVATSWAAKESGLKSIGIIRGEELIGDNPSLQRAKKNGMELHFVDRITYRKKDEINWQKQFGSCFIVPEGGTNKLAVKGCEEFLVTTDFDYVCCSVGTGGTISGIINSISNQQLAIGFSALKNGYFLEDEIKKYVFSSNWSLNHDFHFNGYAKMNKKLVDFMNNFKKKYAITLDPVYTSKLFYGVFNLIEESYFKENSKVLIVHTGGLQSIEGMNLSIKSKKWFIE